MILCDCADVVGVGLDDCGESTSTFVWAILLEMGFAFAFAIVAIAFHDVSIFPNWIAYAASSFAGGSDAAVVALAFPFSFAAKECLSVVIVGEVHGVC